MKYSKEIYDKDVLIKAAYAISDKVYMHIDADEGYYLIEFSPKDQTDGCDYGKEFENELLAQQTRKIVLSKTKNIRELIAARALSSTIVELKDNDIEEESIFNSDSILKDWFEEDE